MNLLVERIREEIAGRGPISFARFMEHALYEPGLGYYEKAVVGRQGDYFTSVSVGGLLGELLGFQFGQWSGGDALHLVEAGAHDGRLMADILESLRCHWPELLPRLSCRIVEPSLARRAQQAQTLERFQDKIAWVGAVEEIAPGSVRGVIYSNELLDAMPVHRLGWDEKQQAWFEWGVAWEADRFVWQRMAEPEIKAARNQTLQIPQAMRAVLPEGFVTIASPRAAEWWHHAALRLAKGCLMTFDYGFAAEEFYSPQRVDGTLRAYHRHRQEQDLLARVGLQDLTAAVNFTVLQAMGELAGLTTRAAQSQEQFLTGIFARTLELPGRFPEWTAERRRQFQTLTHPEHLGRSHRVLVQGR